MKKTLVSRVLPAVLSLCCAITMIPSTAIAVGTADTKALYLHVGSPIALSQGNTVSVDGKNPDLVPLIHKNRTLVPLRFISEFFGAEVQYDGTTRTGVIKVKGKTAQFPVGQSYYLLDGVKKQLDTETMIVSDRIFLPLRVISEEIMGLTVAYQNKVIAIGEQASLDEKQTQAIKDRIGIYVKASSLAELKSYMAQSKLLYTTESKDNQPRESVAAPTENVAKAEGVQNSDSSYGYSSTNIQVEGVDEADVIKTDGRYIYLLNGNQVQIVKVGAAMELSAKIPLEDGYAQDMYVAENRLVIIANHYTGNVYPMARSEDAAVSKSMVMPPDWGKSLTYAKVYDCSDMNNIKVLRSFEVEGNLVTTRKQGDYLYLLTNVSLWNRNEGDVLPMMGENGKLAAMPVSDIMVMPGRPAEAYLTLSAIHLKDPSVAVSSETVAAGGYTTYMSNNAMYVALNNWYEDDANKLDIARFTIKDGSIGFAGSGQVKGFLNNQFSMDESKGYLRVATTNWNAVSNQNENNLYVLDSGMQISGAIVGFAPNERIYSTRFIGDRGYVVTFRQVDPLFVFDLTDPQNPKITGELKVPGFSSYLHPISEHVILGVGSEVKDVYIKDKNGNEVVISQQTGGIKLSLFDVSDMGKPREIDSIVIGDRGYTELANNHKAAMFKPNQSMLAFPASLSSYDYKDQWNGALFISYSGNQLKELSRITAADPGDGYYDYGTLGQRIVYIGETLYFAQGHIIRSLDSQSFRETGSLTLR